MASAFMHIGWRTVVYTLLIYLLALILSSFGIVIGKSFLTGSAGPNTRFAALVIACPAVFLLLSFRDGSRRLFLSHLSAIFLVALWEFVTYPSNPPMNFVRQLPADLEIKLPLLFLFGVIASIRAGSQCKLAN